MESLRSFAVLYLVLFALFLAHALPTAVFSAIAGWLRRRRGLPPRNSSAFLLDRPLRRDPLVWVSLYWTFGLAITALASRQSEDTQGETAWHASWKAIAAAMMALLVAHFRRRIRRRIAPFDAVDASGTVGSDVRRSLIAVSAVLAVTIAGAAAWRAGYASSERRSNEYVASVLGDATYLEDLMAQQKAWNAASLPFARDYLDDKVTAEQWLATAATALPRMRGVMTDARATIAGIRSQDTMAEFGADWLAAKEEQLAAAEHLFDAVMTGDVSDEDAALREFQAAADRSMALARRMLELVQRSS